MKKRFLPSLCLITPVMLCNVAAWANNPLPITTTVNLNEVKASYLEHNYSKTITLGEQYLSAYPHDTDVALYVGLAYKQLNDCPKALPKFKLILQAAPGYNDAREPMIDCLLSSKAYDEAMSTINQALNLAPQDANLLYQKAKLLVLMGKKAEAKTLLAETLKIEPHPTDAETLSQNLQNEKTLILQEKMDEKAKAKAKAKHHAAAKQNAVSSKQAIKTTARRLSTLTPIHQPKSVQPYNLVGIWTDGMLVNVPDQTWNYSQLYAYHINEWGQFGGAVNYTHRYAQEAPQIEINAIPKLNQYLSLDLAYAYANRPELFPNHLERAELYAYLPNGFEGSVGGAHRQIANSILDSATGSIAKYFGNYYINYRPTYFVPGKHGPESFFNRLGLRRYSDEVENKYIGLVLGYGTSPDITDLTTVEYIKVKNRLILVEGQQPLTHDLAFTYGGGYEELIYPNDFLRSLVHLNIGLKYRFE